MRTLALCLALFCLIGLSTQYYSRSSSDSSSTQSYSTGTYVSSSVSSTSSSASSSTSSSSTSSSTTLASSNSVLSIPSTSDDGSTSSTTSSVLESSHRYNFNSPFVPTKDPFGPPIVVSDGSHITIENESTISRKKADSSELLNEILTGETYHTFSHIRPDTVIGTLDSTWYNHLSTLNYPGTARTTVQSASSSITSGSTSSSDSSSSQSSDSSSSSTSSSDSIESSDSSDDDDLEYSIHLRTYHRVDSKYGTSYEQESWTGTGHWSGTLANGEHLSIGSGGVSQQSQYTKYNGNQVNQVSNN